MLAPFSWRNDMLGNLIALLIAAGALYVGYLMIKHKPPFDK